jgi:AbrB family looped-hinge helix DNA binding protein
MAMETTKMSSRGQVVIPEEIRNKLGLKTGDRFLVIADNDVVILKSLISPSLGEFDYLIREARKQARITGLKRSDIVNAVAKVRRDK